MLNIYLTK